VLKNMGLSRPLILYSIYKLSVLGRKKEEGERKYFFVEY